MQDQIQEQLNALKVRLFDTQEQLSQIQNLNRQLVAEISEAAGVNLNQANATLGTLIEVVEKHAKAFNIPRDTTEELKY